MNFYNTVNIKSIEIDYPDIYFTPEYGEACYFSDNSEWELCNYKDLIYVYLKKEYIYEGVKYYDLITPYGYSGYYFKNEETLNEFIPLFRNEAKNRNYLTEVVRQNPYINIDISKKYDIITSKKIFSIEIDNYDIYYNKLNRKIKSMINKANTLKYSHEIISLEEDNIKNFFINLYNFTMNKVNSSKYYYFNKEYFRQLGKINNCYLINIYDNKKKLIGCSIILTYKNFIYYHLSCSDYSTNCISNYLLNSIIKEIGINKKIILGGGIINNDSLHKFKKGISSNDYDYIIYKNILNNEINDKIKSLYNNNNFPTRS